MQRKAYAHISFEEDAGDEFREFARQKRVTNTQMLKVLLKTYKWVRKNSVMLKEFKDQQ